VSVADRLAELGLELPPVFPPAANYVGCVVSGDHAFVSGHGPVGADGLVKGKVGAALTIEEGRAAARLTTLSLLATLQAELGSLDRIERIVKVLGMVNCAPGFDQIPTVIDGCSDLLVEVFGERGRHARSAVGMAELPFGIPVEIELIARVSHPGSLGSPSRATP
jgi:enamine deaminase RidA (YjgF/YER057c/UK114 family)